MLKNLKKREERESIRWTFSINLDLVWFDWEIRKRSGVAREELRNPFVQRETENISRLIVILETLEVYSVGSVCNLVTHRR